MKNDNLMNRIRFFKKPPKEMFTEHTGTVRVHAVSVSVHFAKEIEKIIITIKAIKKYENKAFYFNCATYSLRNFGSSTNRILKE